MLYAHDVVGDDKICHRSGELKTSDDLKPSFTEYSAIIALQKLDRNEMTGVLSKNLSINLVLGKTFDMISGEL